MYKDLWKGRNLAGLLLYNNLWKVRNLAGLSLYDNLWKGRNQAGLSLYNNLWKGTRARASNYSSPSIRPYILTVLRGRFVWPNLIRLLVVLKYPILRFPKKAHFWGHRTKSPGAAQGSMESDYIVLFLQCTYIPEIYLLN